MDIKELNNIQLDVLTEIGNIGSGNAATALAKMLNKKVDMNVPKAKIIELSQVSEILGDPSRIVIGILLEVVGDIGGYIMFILDENEAKSLLELIVGKYSDGKIEYDDLTISALKEVGNIMSGSYLGALSVLTKLKIMPCVPEFALDMAGAILSFPAIALGKTGDTVLYIETEFIEGKEKVIGDFFLVPDVESYSILLKALEVSV